jgi:hypothetical protein
VARGQVPPVGFPNRVDNPDAKIILGHKLAGKACVSFKLLTSQEEVFVLRRVIGVPGFDPHEAEAAGPISPATGAHPKAGRIQDFAQGSPRGKGYLAQNILV